MTGNMEIIFQQIRQLIETEYASKLPTEDQIYEKAETIRKAFSALYPLTDDEFENIKKRLPEHIIHSIGYADTLRSRDSDHKAGWYLQNDTDGFFWNRYRTYLNKKWSTPIVDRLQKTTDDIMDDLGNPHSEEPFQRRGLLLGDVQSGKTATYTAICNKAADAGYRVIIVLAGMMENLRIQTQERLDKEFVGLDSKYTLDKNADSAMRNKQVGVGLIPPFNTDRRITRFTSVSTDFKASVIKSNGLNLNDLKGTALFVVKKNKSILNNLQTWLTKDEDVLNLPLLLIDDEADNASVNTNSDEHNPTAINAAINKILRSFRQATYLGITATPFANIFIDPDVASDGAAKDLFPRHFLTLLPIPDNYIGADKIFGNGSEQDWTDRTGNKYEHALIPVRNIEQEDYYCFRHKKDIAGSLFDIPLSMKEAIRYFILATAITDSRFDSEEHRSMMINVSRFTDVQIATADIVEEYVDQLSSDIENYHALPINVAMQIQNISQLHHTWQKYKLENVAGISWEKLLSKHLSKAARRIEIRAVNQKTGAKSLDYYNYENGMRVIAIGGNSLSRGLTLEGLIVSYFYRNTMMYDTLLQMGRWFGYRNNYEDLFKIWMGEDAIGWYAHITDAFNELKSELRIMARSNLTPEDFGLKVRQDPGSLIVTARNKMRSGTSVSVPITVSGRMIETPRLWNDPQIISKNNALCESFLQRVNFEPMVTREYDDKVHAFIWRHVPKELIVELVSDYQSHPWNLNFQSKSLATLIKEDEFNYWDVAVPSSGLDEKTYTLQLSESEALDLHAENRKITRDNTVGKMLRVNERHVRVGSGGCTKIGLSQSTIKAIEKATKMAGDKITDRTYLIESRNPIVLLHLMHNTNEELCDFPEYIYAIGLGFPGGKVEKKANYIVNTIELQKYIDIEDICDDDNEF